MNNLSKVFGAFLLVVAVVLGLQFIFENAYTGLAGFSTDAIWAGINFFTAAGLLICIVTNGRLSHLASRGNSSSLAANLLFYFSLTVGLAFFHNWVARLADNSSEVHTFIWAIVDATAVPIFIATGWRLWSGSGDDTAESNESE